MSLAMAWDACSKMSGTPAVVIRARDPIEEIEIINYGIRNSSTSSILRL